MASSIWLKKNKTSNVKLLKICLKHATYNSKYDDLSLDDSFAATKCVLSDVYCYIKYGSHLETHSETIISNLVYTMRKCRLLDIMILHRRYRGVDNMISRRSKVIYKMLLTVGRYLSGKNLTKLALFYV